MSRDCSCSSARVRTPSRYAGTGKTLLARQIAGFLGSRMVTLVHGPEVLSKYVGGSEENIRTLFDAAEKEWATRGARERRWRRRRGRALVHDG